MKPMTVATICACAAALALTPVDPVRADAGDAIAGAIVGGLIGHAIAKDQQRRKTTSNTHSSSKAKPAKPGISAAQRAQNREVQTALNQFGYDVGTPDGAIGPKSRAAISQFQASLGYPPTGQLTDYERKILVAAYHRAIAGGPQVSQIAATNPMGLKGLLLVQRDEMAGWSSAPTMAPVVAGAAVAAGAAAATLPALVAEPVPAAPTAAPALPAFGGTLVSLSSHCNAIALKTNANGGFATLAAMPDPAQALSEQFCVSRAAAIQQGEALARAVPGETPQQVAEQCKAFGPVLKDHITAVSLKPAPEVVAGVTQFITQSACRLRSYLGHPKICLGVGYALDDAEVALGSALVLTALGEAGYSSLPGFHLADGIGATQRPDLAMSWIELAKGASLGGTAGQGDLLHKAIFALNGRSDEAPMAPSSPLPVLVPTPQGSMAASPLAAPPSRQEAASAAAVLTALPRLMLGN